MRGRRPALAALVAPLLAAHASAAPPGGPSPAGARGRARGDAAAAMVVAQVPASSSALAGGAAAGGAGGRLVLVPAGAKARVLTAGFHSAADPEVSFDGKSVLFAGKRAAPDPWCVYEMEAGGGEARKVTCGAAGARQPVYQPTVYTITPTSVEPWVQVAFVGENPGERNEAREGPNTSLWSSRTDGTALRRLTYNLSNDADPVVLPDGRMVYAGWLRSPGPEPRDRVALLGVNADGTDCQTYAGEQGLRAKRMAAPTARGLVVFVESERIDGDAGRLASVRQERPLHTYRSLTGGADGLYRAPSPLPDGRVLVSWRDPSGGEPWSIWRFDPETGRREKAFVEAGWHSVGARLLAPRPVPDARSSVVRDDDPGGNLYTMDVGIQEPGKELPKGAARRLRVVEGVPATAERDAVHRPLGEIPLADDGSYQVQVPANTPLRLDLLDAGGAVLRRSAWLWVRNHAAQGCVGCHEDPERVPPNRLVKALALPAPVLTRPADARPGPGSDGPPSEAGVRAFVRTIAPGEKR